MSWKHGLVVFEIKVSDIVVACQDISSPLNCIVLADYQHFSWDDCFRISNLLINILFNTREFNDQFLPAQPGSAWLCWFTWFKFRSQLIWGKNASLNSLSRPFHSSPSQHSAPGWQWIKLISTMLWSFIKIFQVLSKIFSDNTLNL